ncbi:hypothetical protein Nmel_006088 [Mimus melanotis]
MQELNLMVHGKLVMTHNGCAAKEEVEAVWEEGPRHSAFEELPEKPENYIFQNTCS